MGSAATEDQPQGLMGRLEALIRSNGDVKEETRMEAFGREQPGDSFDADLILSDEDGFEIWLGSFEDALALQSLRDRGIDGILNCAVEECWRECLAFRGLGSGRRRAHARGVSAMDGSQQPGDSEDRLVLDRDHVRRVAAFDAEWYSSMLGRDTSFLGIAANDEEGYGMAQHFAEAGEFLAQCRREHRKVLVHCVMGINRSSAAVAAFLCQELGTGLTPAVELISRHRGHVLSNSSFLRQLIAAYGEGADCQ